MEFKSFNGHRWKIFTQHRIETAVKIKESKTYANVKGKNEEEISAGTCDVFDRELILAAHSEQCWVTLAPELKEMRLLELYVLSREASITEPVYQDPAMHLRIRAEHILLEDNEDAPFPVIRDFGENTFTRLVG